MKKIVANIITFIILILIATNVQASSKINANISSNTAELKAKEEVVITLQLNEYQDIRTGINAYKATIKYDTNVFDELTESNFTTVNGWTGLQYNKDTKEFVSIKKAGSTVAENVVRITLSVKENVIAQSTVVEINNITASEGKEDLKVEKTDISLDIITEDSSLGTTTPGGSKDPNQSENMYPDKIPHTGDTLHILFVVLLLCACGLFAFLTAKKAKSLGRKINRKGKVILGIIFATILSINFVGAAVSNLISKGELNNDSQIDYSDVYLLESHLIHLSNLPEDKLENADMNSDGYITVTDLSLLIQKVEKSIDYKVEIKDVQISNYYPQKGEEITLRIHANVSNDAKIESIKIGNGEYPVSMENDTYVVVFKAPKTSGIYELDISQVTLDIGKTVKVKYKENIDVLKQVPSIVNYTLEEDEENSRLTIKFNVIDTDNSIKTGVFNVTNDDNENIFSEEVVSGKNEFVFSVQKNVEYTISITIGYNLDTDKLTEHQENHSGTLSKQEKAMLIEEYQLELNNIETYNANGEETETFARQEQITIRFNSQNALDLDVVTAIINGEEYEVTSLGENQYQVIIENGFSEIGEKELLITEVVLSNGKHLNVNEGNSVSIFIRKNNPTIENVSIVEEDDKLYIRMQLKDDDATIQKATIIVTDENENILLETDMIVGNRVYEIDTTQIIAKQYHVKVVVTYDNGDTLEQDKILLERTITAKAKVKLQEVNVSKKYVEKEETFTITYKVETNKDNNITKIRVNNIEPTAEKLDDNTYQIELQAGNKAGEQILSTTVFYVGNEATNVNHEDKIEVLKTPLSVSSYTLQEDLEEIIELISFVIEDDDDTFMSGEVQLVHDTSGEIKTIDYEPHVGENKLEIPVEENVEYTLRIILQYNRDIAEEIVDEYVLEKELQLIKDYGLNIDNIKTANEDNVNTKYYKKGEKIELSFTSTDNTKFDPEYVVINGEKYLLEKNGDSYKVLELYAPEESGETELTIEKVIMNNGRELEVEDSKVSIEVLKEEPKVQNFIYGKNDDNKVQVTFNLVDEEDTLLGNATIKIVDEDGNVLLNNNEMQKDRNTVEFTLNKSESYIATIICSYDLDSNKNDNVNKYTDITIYEHEILASTDVIELKEISKTEVYHKKNGSVSKVEYLDLTNGIPTDLQNYYIRIEMKELPTFFASIKEIRQNTDTKKVYVVADQQEFIQYEQDDDVIRRIGEISFEMPYKDGEGEHDIVKKANEFFKEMAKDLKGNYTLDEDLDASDLDSSVVAIAGTFTGKLDGNGHKIINLPVGIFEKLNNATIKNLVIENANVTTSAKAIVAGIIENGSVIENVHVTNSNISNNQNSMGVIVGEARNSTVRFCSATEITVMGNNTIGGIVGNTGNGTTIENCYVTGTLRGTIQHDLGARVGGITGWHSGAIINYCYTNVNIIAPNLTGNGGIIGGPRDGTPRITNSFSITNGTAYKISGFDVLSNVENVYEYEGGSGTTNINGNNNDKVKLLTDLYEKEFYKDQLELSEEVWNLEFVEYRKLPNLKSDPMPKKLEDYEIKENKNQIPNYEEVRKNRDYNADQEIIYYNMAKLMPFADTNRWLEYADYIATDDTTSKVKIEFILPLNKDNELVLGIQEETLTDIKKIRVIFENEESKEFNVTYSKTIDNLVAVYHIDDRKIEYQFGNYIANIDESLISQVINKAKQYDYEAVIAATTEEEESRLYIDYYNESVKSKVGEIITNFLMTQAEYPAYSNNTIVKQQLSDAMMNEDNIKKLLYAYNYYDKWYHIDLDGVTISDLIFFNGNYFDKNMTSDYLIDSIYKASEAQRKTNGTYQFYNTALRSQTGKEMTDFLAYLMKVVNGYDNPSDWVANHFKGILYEQKAYAGTEETTNAIKYRIWDMFANLGDRKNIILPILTAPQEDMYIISIPSQFVIGSMNRYQAYLNKDGRERDRMTDAIISYAEYIGHFYGTAADLVPGSVDILNKNVHIQYDTRFYFPQSNSADAGTQESGTTKDPVMKWVYEAVGQWAAANGSGAYANGTNVWWVVDSALAGGDRPLVVFTHETAHNQDGKFFYGGYSRRKGTGAEAHADDNIAQPNGNGVIVFNLLKKYNITDEITTNFSYERINTPDKIYDYYKDMFETEYVLDYLVGQAFLQLTPEEQAGVVVQASHTPTGTTFSTTYSRISAGEIKKMNLTKIEDLMDNKLLLRSPGTAKDAWSGSYGSGSLYDVYWYQPFNDDGTPDTTSFKRLGKEMLGVGGYENGYITYMSGKSQSDLDALRKITGNPNITWKEYKLGRYNTVQQNLSKIPYFNYNEVIEQFKQALKTDAATGNKNATTNVQALLYGFVKRATNDFTDGDIYNNPQEISITSAQQLITLANANILGNYRLDTDIDFSEITLTEGTYYYINQFMGVLNGNNHKITGIKYPLFNNMIYAQVKNLTINEPKYAGQANAYISINSKNSSIRNVKVLDSNLELPFVNNKTNIFYEYGENEYTVKQFEINSLQDFIDIGATEDGPKKKYILNNDIDFSNASLTSNSVISDTFYGSIDGTGHKIINLPVTLFQNLNSATIENLVIENANITVANNARGILATTTNNQTRINNVHIVDSSLLHNAGGIIEKIGAFAGEANNSIITNCSAYNINLKTSTQVGGIAGTSNSTIENCYVVGTLEGTFRNDVWGTRVGGITAWYTGGTISNCYTDVNIIAPTEKYNGGIIGGASGGIGSEIATTIKNSFSIANGNAYKIAGFNFNSNSTIENVYEYEGGTATTNISENNKDKVKTATEANLRDKNFYVNTLHFDETIWDLDNIAETGYPTLRK